MDMVARPLNVVINELESRHLTYSVIRTRPARTSFALQEDCLYVVRQMLDDEGVYHITVAAKMGKEVF